MFLRRPINISSATAVVFFSLLVSPSWASLSPAPSVHAFVGVHKKHQRHVSATSRHLFLDPSISAAVDIRSLYTQETIESSKSNEWGIPASDTLVPLSNKGEPPKEKLDNGGRITLVGSGPGDPDLLTLKAYKLLQEPDTLVIVDRLVSKEIVDLIKGDVKVARKLPGCAELAQEEIYWWAHQGLAAGKHVIRLKIGDPFVFGRGGEEVLTFRRFGVESKVIPVGSIWLISVSTDILSLVYLVLMNYCSPTLFFRSLLSSSIRAFRRHSRRHCWAISLSHTEEFQIKL